MEKFALAVDFGGSASERPLARTAIFSWSYDGAPAHVRTEPAAEKFLANDVDAAELRCFTARDSMALMRALLSPDRFRRAAAPCASASYRTVRNHG
jgi:hypothetical protein